MPLLQPGRCERLEQPDTFSLLLTKRSKSLRDFQQSAQSRGEETPLLLRVAQKAAAIGLHDEVQQAVRCEVARHYSEIFHVVGKLDRRLLLERAVPVAL